MEKENPSNESICPTCGKPIPEGAPQGMCPSCLMDHASLKTETGLTGDVPLQAPSLETMRAVFPDLEIDSLVGQGGMGFVYKARQSKLDRWVALKVLSPSLAQNPDFAKRFEREAKLLARLNHPNIVAVYDFGRNGDFFFLLMEFVEGVNLREAMRTERFTPQKALSIVPNICEALQFAHDEGVLHRDIKPENILLDTKGRIKIADFGIAKMLEDGSSSATGLTKHGASIGTPHYMAPEQIENPAEVDHRADIYSLGVVFYELLTGELPLGRFGPPSEKSGAETGVDDIVFQALAKEKEQRQQKVSEIKTQVETVSQESTSQTRSKVAENTPEENPTKEVSGWKGLRRLGPKVSTFLIVLFLLAPPLLWIVGTWHLRQSEANAHLEAAQWEVMHEDLTAQVNMYQSELKASNEDVESWTSMMENETDTDFKQQLRQKQSKAILEQELFKQKLEEAVRGLANLQTKPGYEEGSASNFPLAMVITAFVPVCFISLSLYGWRMLRHIRQGMLGREYLIPGMLAALPFPLLVVDTAVGALVLLPFNHGVWVNAGISLSIISIIAVDVWLVRRLLAWMKTGSVTVEGYSSQIDQQPIDSMSEGNLTRNSDSVSKSNFRNIVVSLIGVVICAVLIAWNYYSYRSLLPGRGEMKNQASIRSSDNSPGVSRINASNQEDYLFDKEQHEKLLSELEDKQIQRIQLSRLYENEEDTELKANVLEQMGELDSKIKELRESRDFSQGQLAEWDRVLSGGFSSEGFYQIRKRSQNLILGSLFASAILSVFGFWSLRCIRVGKGSKRYVIPYTFVALFCPLLVLNFLGYKSSVLYLSTPVIGYFLLAIVNYWIFKLVFIWARNQKAFSVTS